jgi:hypothetical protein
MKRLHRLHARCPQANVIAGVRICRRHGAAFVQPELRIFLAEADAAGPGHEFAVSQRCQQRLVETSARFEIAHSDGDVVDHNLSAFPDLRPARRI